MLSRKFQYIVILIFFIGFSSNIIIHHGSRNNSVDNQKDCSIGNTGTMITPSGQSVINTMHVVDFKATYAEAMAIESLQGIVNALKPQLFYIADENDRFWCNYIIQRLNPPVIKYHYTLNSLINSFRTEINGLIIYDSNNLHSRNIAIPFCNTEKGLLVDGNLAITLHDTFSIPILQEYNFSGRWNAETEMLEMYQWLFDNFVSKNMLSTTQLALQGPERAPLVDLLVQDKIFTLWDVNLVEDSEEAKQFFKQVLSFYPRNSPIFGYPYATGENEGQTVGAISEAGQYLLPSDFASNLAFTRHLDFGFDKYQQNREWQNSLPQLNQKIYLSFTISDGDNLQYVENRMLDLWKQKESTTPVPVGWSISPLTIEYAPHKEDYYYLNAQPQDYFMSGPSGAGYIYPNRMGSKDLELYLENSKIYLDRMDLTEIWTLGISNPATFSMMVEKTGINAIFNEYSENVLESVKTTTNDVPIFRMFKHGTTSDELNGWIDQLVPWNSLNRPMFISVWVHCWTQDYYFIEDIAEYCTSKGYPIEIVRPDQLVYLYNLHRAQGLDVYINLMTLIIIAALLGISFFLTLKQKIKNQKRVLSK